MEVLVDESDRSKAKITPGASRLATDMITPFTSAYIDNNMMKKMIEIMIKMIMTIIIMINDNNNIESNRDDADKNYEFNKQT